MEKKKKKSDETGGKSRTTGKQRRQLEVHKNKLRKTWGGLNLEQKNKGLSNSPPLSLQKVFQFLGKIPGLRGESAAGSSLHVGQHCALNHLGKCVLFRKQYQKGGGDTQIMVQKETIRAKVNGREAKKIARGGKGRHFQRIAYIEGGRPGRSDAQQQVS